MQIVDISPDNSQLIQQVADLLFISFQKNYPHPRPNIEAAFKEVEEWSKSVLQSNQQGNFKPIPHSPFPVEQASCLFPIPKSRISQKRNRQNCGCRPRKRSKETRRHYSLGRNRR